MAVGRLTQANSFDVLRVNEPLRPTGHSFADTPEDGVASATALLMATLTPGELFANDFRVLRTLREGGMGSVYVAEQLSTGKQRALKLMLPALANDETFRARFLQEARIGARIESEHVVEVVAAGIDAASGAPWLAMELLEGETLDEAVAPGSGLNVRDVQIVLRQVCHAIGAAHDSGIIHRDLKPENIFLARSRRADGALTVKVLDFGIAKLTSETKAATAAMGTPLWMAPEQTTPGGSVTPATDVWAIGLITFFLLSGRPYWLSANRESTIAALLREVVLEEMPRASLRSQAIGGRSPPDWFDAWFARAANRDPKRRFRDAREAGAAFDAAAGALIGPSASTTAPTAPAVSNDAVVTARPATGSRLIRAGGVLGVVMAFGIVGAKLRSRGPSESSGPRDAKPAATAAGPEKGEAKDEVAAPAPADVASKALPEATYDPAEREVWVTQTKAAISTQLGIKHCTGGDQKSHIVHGTVVLAATGRAAHVSVRDPFKTQAPPYALACAERYMQAVRVPSFRAEWASEPFDVSMIVIGDVR